MSNKNEFLREKPRDAKDEQKFNFLMKVVTFLAIFIGIWAGTQRFCHLVGYDPGWVGQPFYVLQLGKKFAFPLYNPFLLFYWTLMYFRRTNIHDTLYRAYKIIGYTSVSAIVFYFLIEFVLMKFIAQNIFGTARWGNKKDLKKAGLLQNKGGMVLGQLVDADVYVTYDPKKDSNILHLKKPSQKIIQSGIYNTLLSAPTRSGKGVSSVMTTLLSYPGSVIVLDFKSESFEYTSGLRKKFGKVYRWDPTGDKGHHFNPMMEIRPGEDAFSDANLQADILTTPASGGGNATSEHFQTGAKDFLTAVILHCLCSDWKDKSLPGCRKFLAQGDPADPNNKNYIYDLMINSDHGDEMIHQSVVEGAMAQRNRPQDEGGSMLSTVNNALAVFADPKIARNTWNSEFYINEFEETNVPISLYLTIQYNDVARIAPLIRLFITLFSRKFTGGETSANNRKFKVPVLFILDEFDKLGRMDELEMNMGIHNGFGIHYFLIFQSLNQLNKIYTKDHSFLAHARNTIIYAPGTGETESAELVSKICGKESISRTNISYSGGKAQVGYSNKNISAQDQERNLINADEVMKLPLDQLILLCQGLPPYIGRKNVYYEDPVFKARMFPPAFKTREDALKAAASTIKKLNKRRWFDHGDTYRPVEMSDDDIADMWDKVGNLFDEPDETPILNEPDKSGSPITSETENEFSPPPDIANFLK
jgi:type IV secretion system protein VirD4